MPCSKELRPMQLNRFGGLGSHRYPVHHSGDTFALWTVLRWLPSFTLASGNLLCGWLSHDIGGFFNPSGQKPDPELFVRWMQYATVAPVFRTHCGREVAGKINRNFVAKLLTFFFSLP